MLWRLTCIMFNIQKGSVISIKKLYSATHPDLAGYTNNSFIFQNISTCDNSYFLWHFKKSYPISHKYISLLIKVHYPMAIPFSIFFAK